MAPQPAADLFPEARNPEGTIVINDRCQVRSHSGHRVVIVCGITLAHYEVNDTVAEAMAMVSLVEQGLADQNDVAKAFGCSARTLRRHQRRFEAGGLQSLGGVGGYPKGRHRLASSRCQLINRLKAAGHSNREIARRIGVSEMAIRKSLQRLGWKQADRQADLPLEGIEGANPNLSAFSSSPPSPVEPTASLAPSLTVLAGSADRDPADRRTDRLMARLGLLDDALPLFGSGTNLQGAGVLLALPALLHTGIFDCAKKVYGKLGPAFYGLRTSLLTLLLMALWRIKRPEGLKEHSPPALGRVLGLDRAPDVKTLRRRLTQLAALGRAAQLGRELAQQRLTLRGSALGFLYVDGHVRVYHGKHRIPKAHVAQMRLSMPATTDYWVNDAAADPLFVVTAQANASLAKMLPGILEELRSLLGQRRVTFIFDRGGFSPKLFRKIIDAGFDLMTYRKGPIAPIPNARFAPATTRVEGRRYAYVLADQTVRLLKGQLRLRQITRRMVNGHLTPILTSRWDLGAARVAYHMFGRWRQENFFKYLCAEYALDALADHAVEPDDPSREVPNPAWAVADAKLRQAQAEADQLQAQYGFEALISSERTRPSLRGFKIAKGKLGGRIWTVLERVTRLQAQRDKIPKRIPVQSISPDPVVKLAPERKHLFNLIKMVAYQAESELFRAVSPHYARAQDDGRTLIQSALTSTADLEVTKDELRVTLAPLSSPHRTRAITALCEELNKTPVLFPGSSLRLRLAIRAHP